MRIEVVSIISTWRSLYKMYLQIFNENKRNRCMFWVSVNVCKWPTNMVYIWNCVMEGFSFILFPKSRNDLGLFMAPGDKQSKTEDIHWGLHSNIQWWMNSVIEPNDSTAQFKVVTVNWSRLNFKWLFDRKIGVPYVNTKREREKKNTHGNES